MITIERQLTLEETLFSRKILAREYKDPKESEVPLVVTVPIGETGDFTEGTNATKGKRGLELDIKIVNADSPYVDPVLFVYGQELEAFEVTDQLEGIYEFDINEEKHQVILLPHPDADKHE